MDRHESCYWLAVSRDGHFFSILNELQQLAETIFCFESTKSVGGFHFYFCQINLASARLS